MFRRKDIDTDDFVIQSSQSTNQSFAQMTAAACNKNFHFVRYFLRTPLRLPDRKRNCPLTQRDHRPVGESLHRLVSRPGTRETLACLTAQPNRVRASYAPLL